MRTMALGVVVLVGGCGLDPLTGDGSGGLTRCPDRAWSVVATPTTEELTSIWGSSADDFYLGGQGSILHTRDRGAHFEVEYRGPGRRVGGIWGSGPSDVWFAVGSGYVLHSRGSGISSQIAVPGDMHDVWGAGRAAEVYFVGYAGGGLYLPADGGRFTPIAPGGGALASVFGLRDRVFAVGGNQLLEMARRDAPWLVHSWAAKDELIAIGGMAPGELYAVGLGYEGARGRGLLLHSGDGGRAWQRRFVDADERLCAVWLADPQRVFLVGGGGLILRSGDGGASFRREVSGTSAQLNAVWGSGPCDVWAVGERGLVLHRQ